MIVNGLFATVGGHMNPFYSYLVFYVVSRPSYKRRETELYSEIKEAFDHDDHLYYFARNIQKPKAETNTGTEEKKETKADQDAALPIDN